MKKKLTRRDNLRKKRTLKKSIKKKSRRKTFKKGGDKLFGFSIHGMHLRCHDSRVINKWISDSLVNGELRYVTGFRVMKKDNITEYYIAYPGYDRAAFRYSYLKSTVNKWRKYNSDFKFNMRWNTTYRLKGKIKNCKARIKEIDNLFRYLDKYDNKEEFIGTLAIMYRKNV